ncbi:hypothetical protein J73031_00171 [Listeria monocytogenes]|nr:hypothetical protein J73031_00171 [Listeria monocytogenes]
MTAILATIVSSTLLMAGPLIFTALGAFIQNEAVWSILD